MNTAIPVQLINKQVRKISYKVLVDIYGNGNFDVDISDDVDSIDNIIIDLEKNDGSSVLGKPSANTANITLWNEDGRYTPNNPKNIESEYKGGKFRRNTRVKIIFSFIDENNVSYDREIFLGVITNFKRKVHSGDRKMTITLQDFTKFIKRKKNPNHSYAHGQYYEGLLFNATISEAVNYLIDYAYGKEYPREISFLRTVYPVIEFPQDDTIWDTIIKLAEACDAKVFFDGAVFKFISPLADDYNYSQNEPYKLTGSNIYDYAESIDEESIINKVKITSNPKTIQTRQVLVGTPSSDTISLVDEYRFGDGKNALGSDNRTITLKSEDESGNWIDSVYIPLVDCITYVDLVDPTDDSIADMNEKSTIKVWDMKTGKQLTIYDVKIGNTESPAKIILKDELDPKDYHIQISYQYYNTRIVAGKSRWFSFELSNMATEIEFPIVEAHNGVEPINVTDKDSQYNSVCVSDFEIYDNNTKVKFKVTNNMSVTYDEPPNLVMNGSFNNGLSGWDTSGMFGGSVYVSNWKSHDGSKYLACEDAYDSDSSEIIPANGVIKSSFIYALPNKSYQFKCVTKNITSSGSYCLRYKQYDAKGNLIAETPDYTFDTKNQWIWFGGSLVTLENTSKIQIEIEANDVIGQFCFDDFVVYTYTTKRDIAYISKIEICGRPIDCSSPLTFEAIDSDTIDEFENALDISNDYITDVDFGKKVTDYYLHRNKFDKLFIEVNAIGMPHLDLLDRVDLIDIDSNTNLQCIVSGIKHSFKNHTLKTTISLESLIPAWEYDSSKVIFKEFRYVEKGNPILPSIFITSHGDLIQNYSNGVCSYSTTLYFYPLFQYGNFANFIEASVVGQKFEDGKWGVKQYFGSINDIFANSIVVDGLEPGGVLYRFYIIAIDKNNNYSAYDNGYEITTPSDIINTVNLFASYDEKETGWKGEKTNLQLINNELWLAGIGNIYDITNIYSITDLYSYGGVPESGTYTIHADHIVDIGNPAQCTLYYDVDFEGNNNTSYQIELNTAGIDGFWRGWNESNTGKIAIARYFNQRVILYSQDNSVAKLSLFRHKVDVPEAIDKIKYVLVPVGGRKVKYNRSFHMKPVVSCIIYNAQPGDTYIINNDLITTEDLYIEIQNNGIQVERYVDLILLGY